MIRQAIITDKTKDSSGNYHLQSKDVNDIWADSNYVYVAEGGGLSVLDKSNLDVVAHISHSGGFKSVWASNSYVYMASWGDGLYRIDKSSIVGATSATQFLTTSSSPSLPTDYLYKVRGYSDSAILIGHSKGVSFYNGSSVYDGYHLLADDFVDNNVGDDPAGWTVTEEADTSCSVETDPFDSFEKCVKLVSSSTGNVWIEKNFTAKSKVILRVLVTHTSTSSGAMQIQVGSDADSQSEVALVRLYSGNFEYKDSTGWHGLGHTYETWRSYNVVITIDCDSDQFSVEVDGVLFVQGVSTVNAVSSVDHLWLTQYSSTGTSFVHSVYITDATSDTFWGGPSKAVAITSSEIYYSTGSGVARKDSYPTANWEGAVDFHYDEGSTPGLIKDLPGKFEVTDLAVAEDKSSQDSTANKLVVGQRNGVTVIDEHSTPSSGVSTHYGRSDLTTDRQDKLAGYSDVAGAVAIDSDGSYLYVGTREDDVAGDNFEGTSVDFVRWCVDKSDETCSVSFNDALELSISGTGSGTRESRLISNFLITGPFDIQVEWDSLTGDEVVACHFMVFDPETTNGAEVFRYRNGATQYVTGRIFHNKPSWGEDHTDVEYTALQGKFRLVRYNDSIAFYYWNNGWTEIASYTPNNSSDFYPEHFKPMGVRLDLRSKSPNYPECSVKFKNFKINKGTIIWLNGKPKGAYTKLKLSDNTVVEFLEEQDLKAIFPE